MCCLPEVSETQAPSTVPTAKDFNQQVQADILWIKDKEMKFPILSMVDVGTKFQAACLVRGESAEYLIGALEKCWLRHFRAPRQLHTDEGRGWLGEQFQNWTTDRMIEHLVPLVKPMNVLDWWKGGTLSYGRPSKCTSMIWN